MSDPQSYTPAPIDGLRCLITGGAGYLGQNLARALLARGCTVHVLDTLAGEQAAPELASHPRVRWFVGDIRKPADVRAACEGVDVVFHTAALIELARRAPEPFKALVRSVNIEGTRVLVEQAAAAGVTRFVHTSSTNVVYGQRCVGGDETLPYSTSEDLYSSTKAEAERVALGANGALMRTCAIRPGGIYGPGERKTLIGPVVASIQQGMPVIGFGDGSTRLDYTYIDNLVDGQLRAAERLVPGSPVCGSAYFVTDDQPINPAEFSVRLVRLMGLGTTARRIPRRVAMAMAKGSELAFERFGKPRPQVTEVGVNLCTLDNFFSIAKARRDLGYAPVVTLEEGLRRTAEDAARLYHGLG
ncbi:MAG: NAD-dependent epimerase/dehydratase family protein [Sandaracinaceae bacterium]|jgi:3beta-hydroxy-delta5-steroid dehydrogenase/steroid delta-isomerase|nr:NAD-dependent epimerase/dehydratase family protein [Sandaracinaceae bacterium]